MKFCDAIFSLIGKGERRGPVGGIGGKRKRIRADLAHCCDGRRRENSN